MEWEKTQDCNSHIFFYLPNNQKGKLLSNIRFLRGLGKSFYFVQDFKQYLIDVKDNSPPFYLSKCLNLRQGTLRLLNTEQALQRWQHNSSLS